MGCTTSKPDQAAPSTARKPSTPSTNDLLDIPPPNLAGVGQPASDNDTNASTTSVHADHVKSQTKFLIASALTCLLDLQDFMQDHPPSTFNPQFREEISHDLCTLFDVITDLQVRCKEICSAHDANADFRSCAICIEAAKARVASKWEEKRQIKLRRPSADQK